MQAKKFHTMFIAIVLFVGILVLGKSTPTHAAQVTSPQSHSNIRIITTGGCLHKACLTITPPSQKARLIVTGGCKHKACLSTLSTRTKPRSNVRLIVTGGCKHKACLSITTLQIQRTGRI